jgi:hypothetical protein
VKFGIRVWGARRPDERLFRCPDQCLGQSSVRQRRLRDIRKPFQDGSKPLQYGLIAEEVAEIYPELVARSTDGHIETVKYQMLDSMLLNEVQKLHRKDVAQQQQIKTQEEKIRSLEERLSRMESLLERTTSLTAEH